VKKYELTDETIKHDGHILHRIRALKPFEAANGLGDVRVGELGGWAESEDNLSQDGRSWIFDDAKAFSNARIYENGAINQTACAKENAQIYGSAFASGQVLLGKNTQIYDNGCAYGSVWFDNVRIHGEANVGGDGHILGSFRDNKSEINIYGDADFQLSSDHDYIFGGAEIFSSRHFMSVAPIGEDGFTLIAYRTKDNDITFTYGGECYTGGEAAKLTDKWEELYRHITLDAIHLMRLHIDLMPKEPPDCVCGTCGQWLGRDFIRKYGAAHCPLCGATLAV
jgi:hypothetical protein